MTDNAVLALEDGNLFYGSAIGAAGQCSGEVVFNTAMAGYQEILSDPSYARQIITFTYPHIGNTGCNLEDNESERVWAAGLIIRDLPRLASNWRQQQSLDEFLRARNVTGIADIDTRRLTRLLREKGALRGCILSGQEAVHDAGRAAYQSQVAYNIRCNGLVLTKPVADATGKVDEHAGFRYITPAEAEAIRLSKECPSLKGMDLAKEVSTDKIYQWSEGLWGIKRGYEQAAGQPVSKPRHKVVVYDFGVKRNILRMLVHRGCEVTVVPAQTPPAETLAMQPDGILLSNGPGDPEPCDYAIAATREFLDKGIPLLGICLGCQLLALAAGAKTIKMRLGHHGANHPVQELSSGKVMITSQNHGFAVDADSLPKNLVATHRSLFDGSLQGIKCSDKPALGFQGHPEASPGPHDIAPLFDKFVELMHSHA